MRVLALLPVGQRGLGVAQGVLADAIFLAQLLEPLLRIGDGFLQHLQARLVAVDVLAVLGQRGLGLVACALQALRPLSLVGDLLPEAADVAAAVVTFGILLFPSSPILPPPPEPCLAFRLGLALLVDPRFLP